MTAVDDFPSFATLEVQFVSDRLLQVSLNRPSKANAWNTQQTKDFTECFQLIAQRNDVNVVLLKGNGRHFSAGIDLNTLMNSGTIIKSNNGKQDIARQGLKFRNHLMNLMYQPSKLVAECPVPVICAIHGACYGMAIDISCAADIRYCAKNAYFSIKEVDLAIIPDVGTTARLPLLVANHSLYRELIYSGRKFNCDEAMQLGFVNRIFDDEPKLYAAALDLCKDIASKSPVAVRGIKEMCNLAMDGHRPSDLQKFVGLLNATALQGTDVPEAGKAYMMKTKPKFAKL